MSAYSAEMLEAWRTVTLKVNVLPIFRWDRAFWGDKSSGRSRLRPELLAGLLGVSKEAASNTLWNYFLTNLRPHLLFSLLAIRNMNITLERHRSNTHLLSLGYFRLLHTWTGVVVDLIRRDSNICILSFSLNDAQLLLRGVGVGESTRTRLCLELDQEPNSGNMLKIRYSKSLP